jgi:sec-independent protein translocase protein TatB
VLNIGLGELLALAVLGLLIFGPDKLPAAVSRGMALLRDLRTAAGDARQQMSSAAGLDDPEAKEMVRDLQSLHPKRIAASIMDPVPDGQGRPPAAGSGALDPDLP